MPLPARLLLVLLGAALLAAAPAAAQPEIVPAEHAVYDFLLQQRVRGLLPEYRHEVRPMGRGALGRLLDSLEVRAGGRLGEGPAAWLARYRREILEPPGAVEALIGPTGRLRLPTEAESEKVLFQHRDADWRVVVRGGGRLQLRAADEGGALIGLALVPEGTLEGNYRGVAGFYTSTFNGQQFLGDTQVLGADPVLAPLYYIAIRPEDIQGNFDRSTASLRVAGGGFSAEIAHARLLMGASPAENLLLSANADYFSFLRLGLETRAVQYQALHAGLGERARTVQGDEDGIYVAPERYLALHRLTVNPWRRLQLAFTEAVVYGLRGPELAYLNPLYPIKPAEHALWDRDNTLFTLDAVVRPRDGLELYGTFLADDLDFGKIGQGSYNNKWALQAGAAATLGSALGWLEYTRIEPFVYTHRFLAEGSFYNSYTHNGFGLGHPLGPNTDQWEAGVRAWLPGQVRAELRARYVRHGRNYTDPETGELVNVGGDVRDGRQPPFSEHTKVFLAGERLQGPGLRLGLEWEPVRALALRVFSDFQHWGEGAPVRFFARTEVVVGL